MTQHKSNPRLSFWAKLKSQKKRGNPQPKASKYILAALLKHNLITWQEVKSSVR